MATDWQLVTLGDITEVNSPITYGVVKPGGEDPDGVRFVRAGDIADGRVMRHQLRTITQEVSAQYRRTVLRGGELVVSLVGNPGQVAVVPAELKDANIARQVGLIRLRQTVDAHFVRYALSSHAGQSSLGAHRLGSVQQVINLRDLRSVTLRLPALEEQRAIAHILRTLDDKIELNLRMSGTLEAMAGALHKSWFVDFEPVTDKRQGQVTERLATHFPRSLSPEMGNVPQVWEITRLHEIAQQQRDLIDPRQRPDDLFDHFSLPAYDDDQRPQAQRGATIKSVKYRVPFGSVLLSKLNPAFPRIWLVEPERHTRPICSTEFLVLVPKAPATRDYLYCLLSSSEFQAALRSLATGTSGSHQRARPDAVLNLPVLRPPSGLLAEFGRLVSPLLGRSLAARRESTTLTALRDTLMPKLITGELRVPYARRAWRQEAAP